MHPSRSQTFFKNLCTCVSVISDDYEKLQIFFFFLFQFFNVFIHFVCVQDCEDHAVLLCSLLLGFGLNAFVCVGTKAKGAAHSWVMTLAPDGLVTFWESLTGHR